MSSLLQHIVEKWRALVGAKKPSASPYQEAIEKLEVLNVLTRSLPMARIEVLHGNIAAYSRRLQYLNDCYAQRRAIRQQKDATLRSVLLPNWYLDERGCYLDLESQTQYFVEQARLFLTNHQEVDTLLTIPAEVEMWKYWTSQYVENLFTLLKRIEAVAL